MKKILSKFYFFCDFIEYLNVIILSTRIGLTPSVVNAIAKSEAVGRFRKFTNQKPFSNDDLKLAELISNPRYGIGVFSTSGFQLFYLMLVFSVIACIFFYLTGFYFDELLKNVLLIVVPSLLILCMRGSKFGSREENFQIFDAYFLNQSKMRKYCVITAYIISYFILLIVVYIFAILIVTR